MLHKTNYVTYTRKTVSLFKEYHTPHCIHIHNLSFHGLDLVVELIGTEYSYNLGSSLNFLQEPQII
jgi:hypothetical protein